MSILMILLALVAIGFIVWVINTYVPMGPGFKKAVNIIAILVIIWWLLKAFGILEWLASVKI